MTESDIGNVNSLLDTTSSPVPPLRHPFRHEMLLGYAPKTILPTQMAFLRLADCVTDLSPTDSPQIRSQAEADEAAPVSGRAPATARGSAAPRDVVPAAPTKYAVPASCKSSRCWSCGVVYGRVGVIVVGIPIRAPLPYVAMHIK